MCFFWNCRSETSKTPVKSAEKKNKKQKKNSSEEATTVESKTISGSVEKQKTPEQSQVKSNASQERTYPNGLIVEELRMGRPDGKKAAPGKQVCALLVINSMYDISYYYYCIYVT